MPRQLRGFTLIELIMVIVITGIIASIVGIFIRQPVEGYMDLTRRAQLVDAAESALRLMARDIRRALPNSIRISGTTAIEMINTVEGVRYRHDPPGTPLQRLDFDTADQSFNAIGTFSTITNRPFASTGQRLVIYNLGGAGADAYDATTGVITPAATTFTITADLAPPGGSGAEDQILLSAGHQFPFQSPRQRLFMVDGPISYICNTGTGFLRRFTGYALAAAQPVPPAVPGIPVTRFVSACTFTYAAGTAERAGLVTVALTLTDQGESINLLHQVHVDNVP